MQILSSMTRMFALLAAFGLFFSTTGCGKPSGEGTADLPSTDMGESGSHTGGGVEVPIDPKTDESKTDESKTDESKKIGRAHV